MNTVGFVILVVVAVGAIVYVTAISILLIRKLRKGGNKHEAHPT